MASHLSIRFIRCALQINQLYQKKQRDKVSFSHTKKSQSSINKMYTNPERILWIK